MEVFGFDKIFEHFGWDGKVVATTIIIFLLTVAAAVLFIVILKRLLHDLSQSRKETQSTKKKLIHELPDSHHEIKSDEFQQKYAKRRK